MTLPHRGTVSPRISQQSAREDMFSPGGTGARGIMPAGQDLPESPINWLSLDAAAARAALIELDRWVTFLRATYGLAPSILPPLWHRHDELVWELSALHLHWLNSYHPDASLSAPNHWHQDFAAARVRLREWVATNGTRLDRDRPTRTTTWPGESTQAVIGESLISDRAADFRRFLDEDTTQRNRRKRAQPG